MSNKKIQSPSTNDLQLNIFFGSYSFRDLLFSTDTLWALICTNVIMSIITYFLIILKTTQKAHDFLIDISNMICSNAINIDSSLLGIIIAAIAIFASFSRPELLAQVYAYKKDERRLHQYVLVLFFPAIPAIIGIFSAFIGNVLIVAENKLSIFLALISLFFTFYCIFGVWESIKQIAKSIITQAKSKTIQ